MRKKLLLLLIVISGMTIALLTIEIFLRNNKNFYIYPRLTQKSQIFGHDYIPNLKKTYKTNDFETKIIINSQGFRDREFNRVKSNNSYRIAILGDSLIAGLEVDLNDTVAKKLEKLLNNYQNNNVEVINFGVPGFGTDHEYLYLKNKVLQFQPDLIIFSFNPNDLDDLKASGIIDNNISHLTFKKIDGGNIYLEKLKTFANNVYLTNYLYQTYLYKIYKKGSNFQDQLFIAQFDQERLNPSLIKQLQLVINLILISKEIAQKNNADFLFLISTDPQTLAKYSKLNTTENEINSVFTTLIKNNDIHYLDLLPIFLNEIQSDKNIYFAGDVHLNQYGHEIMANALNKYIMKNLFGLVD